MAVRVLTLFLAAVPTAAATPAVVYSRCGGTPEPPADRSAADCELFSLGPRDDRGERLIRNASSGGSEF